jgi:hypothetical protein
MPDPGLPPGGGVLDNNDIGIGTTLSNNLYQVGDVCPDAESWDDSVTPKTGGDFSDETQCFPYLRYEYQSSYDYDPGIMGLPLSGSTGGSPPTATSLIIQVRRPRTVRTVTFSMIRQGARPVIPSPVSPGVLDGSEVLMGSSISPAVPVLQEDGNMYNYGLSGAYTYLQLDPDVPGEDPLRMGLSRVNIGNADNNLVEPDDFSEEVQ